MLTLNGKKMAKSTGNNILPNEILNGNTDLLSKSFSPSVVRFFMMQAHYRSILDFSDSALVASEKGFQKLMEALETVKAIKPSKSSTYFDVVSWKKRCYDAMNDDFNTPILISELFSAVKFINQVNEGSNNVCESDLKIIKNTMECFVFDILGLENNNISSKNTKLNEAIELLIKLRNQARKQKNFDLSDEIRNRLEEIGITVKDHKSKTNF